MYSGCPRFFFRWFLVQSKNFLGTSHRLRFNSRILHKSHCNLRNYLSFRYIKNKIKGASIQIKIALKSVKRLSKLAINFCMVTVFHVWHNLVLTLEFFTVFVVLLCKIFFCKVLILCVEFRELSHLTTDLSQAEKKINAVTSRANAQNDINFTQNGCSCHFEWKYVLRHVVSCSACNNSYFLLILR